MELLTTLAVALCLVVLWSLLRRHGHRRSTQNLTCGFVCAVMVMFSIIQHGAFPEPPSVDYKMPSAMSSYQYPARAAQGDGIVVGNPAAAILEDPSITQDFVLASSWYLTERDIQSVYSTIGFSTYNKVYCRRYNGTSCKGLLKTLFQKEPGTDSTRADLLSVSTVQIFREGISDKALLNPPDGWSVAYESDSAVTWTRDVTRPAAGGVVWTSNGVSAKEVEVTPRSATLTIAPGSGGNIALSRLAWPGYRVTGGTLADPIEGYLLQVSVPASASETTVRIEFSPPGWALEVFTWWLGVGSMLLWGLAPLAAGLRGRSRRPSSRDNR